MANATKRASKKRKKPKKRSKATDAERADLHALYQKAVQDPSFDVGLVERLYKKYRRRKPYSIKEDFCGTAIFAAEWVKSHKKRTAVGVDLDAPTLAWGQEHNLGALKKSQRERVTLLEANVLDVREPRVDVVAAFNYSYSVFKKRADLLRYFEAVRASLKDDGMFMLDLYGGTEAIEAVDDTPRSYPGFEYQWQQAAYNPITNETLCHIHFRFPDGSTLERAFTYDWRLWTIAELRELLEEAGFASSHVWWDDGEADDYIETDEAENQAGWLAYICALA